MANPLFGLTPITAGAAVTTAPITTGTDLTAATGEALTAVYATGASNNQVLTADSTQASGIKWATTAATSLTSTSTAPGSDVAVTANAAVVVVSGVSLSIGTWLVIAALEFVNGGSVAGDINIFILNGTGVGSQAGMTGADGEVPPLTGGAVGLSFATILTVTTAGTFDLYARSTVAGTAMALTTAGNSRVTSGYVAVKIA